jgi:hypothetical protein
MSQNAMRSSLRSGSNLVTILDNLERRGLVTRDEP